MRMFGTLQSLSCHTSIRSLSLSRNLSPNTASNTPRHLSRATASISSKPTSRDSTLTTSTPHAPTIWRPISSSMSPAQSSRKPSQGLISQIATLGISPKPVLGREEIEVRDSTIELYKLQQLQTNQMKKMKKHCPTLLLKIFQSTQQDSLQRSINQTPSHPKTSL